MRICLTLAAIGCLWLAGCEAQSVPVAAPPPTVTTTGTVEPSLSTDDAAASPVEATPVEAAPATSESTLQPTTGEATAAVEATPAEATPVEAAPAEATPAAVEAAGEAKPVPVVDGVPTISPENTRIQFVCAHVGDKPDPRTGWFEKFSVSARVDTAAKQLEAITVEIETASLTTDIQKLTDHLKSGDFFEVNEFPTAKFESTKVEQTGDKATITGNLTLHGVTKEISFPATVSFSKAGFSLKSDFDIDRTQFGMTFGEGKVENKVSLSVVIGK
jgi:polyisoprenoid-binding protein YceI